MSSSDAPKIGVLGGSFNPVHLGHLSIAQQVVSNLKLDKAILIPAGLPPHKDSAKMASAEDRLEMCRIAVRGLHGLEVSDLEVRKQTTSYTIETIQALQKELPEGAKTWFIIGADTVPELPTWHRIQELVSLTNWAIVRRPKVRKPDFKEIADALSEESARRLEAGLVQIEEPVDISSTEIRQRLEAGDHVRGLLRKDVEEYIRKKGLYGAPAQPK